MTDNDNFTIFWDRYKKKDNKKKAEIAFNRLSKTKQELILEDLLTRYKDTERQYIPLPTSYINGEKWNDEKEAVEGEKAIREPLKTCCIENCNNEVHGPSFIHCIECLPEPNSPILDKLRKIYKDNGLGRQEGESARLHSLRLRKKYMRSMFDSLHPPIKPMEK